MVQAGRVACIFTPFALTLAALVCLVVIFMAGTIENNQTLGDLYFAKLDLTNLTLTPSANLLSSVQNITALTGALQHAKQNSGLKDYYTIYLRNYCSWNGNDEYAYCSPRQSKFFFDPVTVWGLNSTGYDVDEILPKSFRAGLDTYKHVSAAIFYMYSISLGAVSLTILVGFSAMFSRWGSLATTFFASLGTFLIIVASILASIVFPILKGALNETLDKDYGIKTSLGSRIYALTWICVAFSVGSFMFWFLSICCCSGRSPYHHGAKDARRTRAEKTPYTYERVGSPYLGPRDGQAVPLDTLNSHGHMGYHQGPVAQQPPHTAYEPFRVQHV